MSIARRLRGELGSLIARARATPAYLWCLLAGLSANIFSGGSGYLGLPISLDRLFIPLAFVLLALDTRRPPLRPVLVHWLMVAFVLWTLWSMADHANLTQSIPLFALLDRTMIPFLLFATAPLFFDTPERRDLLLRVLCLIGLYLGITAILEMAAPALVRPSYIVSPDVGMQFGRARGPFVASEAMGAALAFLTLVAGLAAQRLRGAWRAIACAVAVLDLIGVAFTMTRSVWVGLIVGVVGASLLSPTLRRRLPLILGGPALVLGLVLATIPPALAALTDRLSTKESVYDRLGSNDAAVRLLGDMPLTGIGWRRFYPHGSDWFRQSEAYPLNEVVIEIHSVILSRATELGIPAAILFVAILVVGPLRSLRIRASGDLEGWRVLSAGVFISWLVIGLSGPMAMPFPNYVAFLVAGVASASWLSAPIPNSASVLHEEPRSPIGT